MLMAYVKRARNAISVMLMVLLTMGALVNPVAAQNESLQSQLTGVTIAWEPVYALESDVSYADDTLEIFVFSGAADLLSIGFLPPLIDINAARDIMIESLVGETTAFATIDRGDYPGVSYSLDMMNLGGQEVGVFNLFMNQRSHGFAEFYVFVAPPAYFATAMQTAQQSVSVDGVPILDGIDTQAMGDLVLANVGVTGGTAVTDVSGLTDKPADPTAIPATTGTDQDARADYLAAVNAEYAASDEPFLAIFSLLDELNAGGDAQVIRPQIDQAAAALVGTSDRVAAIQPPAGMEAFHQEFSAWGGALTAVGVSWQNFVNGQASSEDFLASLTTALESHIAFGEVLFAEPATTGTTTDVPATTETIDATAYIQSIEDQRVAFLTTYLEFNDLTGSLSSEATEAEIQESLQATYTIAEGWAGYADTAAQLTPPAGYEDIHALYLSWADEVTLLGNLWMGAINQDGTTAEDFTAQLAVVLTVDEQLGAAIEAVDTGTSTTSTTGTTGSTRSSRTTTTETPTATAASGRTTRTTTTKTPEATETTTGTTRSTRTTNTTTTGNTSETKGRTSSLGTTAANEWYMEANDVTITWSDDFALNDAVDDPQTSDTTEAEDKIYLQWVDPEGSLSRFSVTVFESSGDATSIVGNFVDDEAALQDLFGADAVIVDSVLDPAASALLINTVDEQGEYWVYLQVTCVNADCSSVSLFLIANDAEPLVLTLEAMDEDVAIDGISISNAIPFDEVEDAIVGFAR